MRCQIGYVWQKTPPFLAMDSGEVLGPLIKDGNVLEEQLVKKKIEWRESDHKRLSYKSYTRQIFVLKNS